MFLTLNLIDFPPTINCQWEECIAFAYHEIQEVDLKEEEVQRSIYLCRQHEKCWSKSEGLVQLFHKIFESNDEIAPTDHTLDDFKFRVRVTTIPLEQYISHCNEFIRFHCDGCGKTPLKPPNHYRCTECDDYDLCKECYDLNVHPLHREQLLLFDE